MDGCFTIRINKTDVVETASSMHIWQNIVVILTHVGFLYCHVDDRSGYVLPLKFNNIQATSCALGRQGGGVWVRVINNDGKLCKYLVMKAIFASTRPILESKLNKISLKYCEKTVKLEFCTPVCNQNMYS